MSVTSSFSWTRGNRSLRTLWKAAQRSGSFWPSKEVVSAWTISESFWAKGRETSSGSSAT